MPNETIYLNTAEHEFVKTFAGDNFSQKVRKIIQSQMDQQGLEVRK